MGLTDAILIADAKRMIDAFDPETLVYRPDGGTARNVKALVDRETPAPTAEAPRAMAPEIHVALVNQATSSDDDTYGGISAGEIDTGKDRIVIALRAGATAVERGLGPLVEQDGGMIRLEVR